MESCPVEKGLAGVGVEKDVSADECAGGGLGHLWVERCRCAFAIINRNNVIHVITNFIVRCMRAGGCGP